jgi:hypothetical protein
MSKRDILALCQEHGIPYVIDSTNMTEQGGQRNWMRNVMIPLLTSRNSEKQKQQKACDWYGIWRERFFIMDEWYGRIVDSLEVIDLPLCVEWQDVSWAVCVESRAGWTCEHIIMLLMQLGVYQHE